MPSAFNWNRAATCAAPAPGVAEAMITGLHASDGLRGNPAGQDSLAQIRVAAAELFHFPWPDRVIFTPGATFGLNQAVHAIADGATVLTTPLEHNSLLRPLHQAAKQRGLQLETTRLNSHLQVDIDAVRQRLQQGGVDWLAFSLASNVFGTLQPVAELCALAREHDVRVLLDMSQGGGQVDVDLGAWQPDFAVIPGHKGLHGPRGVGLLFVHGDQNPEALVSGGTGSQGEDLDMPEDWPGRMEAGTLNLPGVLGMGAALEWRLKNPAQLDSVRQGLNELEQVLRQRSDLRVLPTTATDWQQRLPILCLETLAMPAEIVAALLDQFGLQVRAGNMCAALAGKELDATNGLLRLSPPESASADEFAQAQTLLLQALDLPA
jgi:selenocysteine lyase/cysteine desulfurase